MKHYFVIDREEYGNVLDCWLTQEKGFADRDYFMSQLIEEYDGCDIEIVPADYGGNRLFTVYTFNTDPRISVKGLDVVLSMVKHDKANTCEVSQSASDFINDIVERDEFPFNSDYVEFKITVN